MVFSKQTRCLSRIIASAHSHGELTAITHRISASVKTCTISSTPEARSPRTTMRAGGEGSDAVVFIIKSASSSGGAVRWPWRWGVGGTVVTVAVGSRKSGLAPVDWQLSTQHVCADC
eukprot:scaffold163741_cov66-Cyclotella_meneghiniana.AAC.6